jgi:PAS domain-containing protein
MRSVAPQFPAVMVLREKGEILFLDRRVCELTGYGVGEHQDLRGLLASLFPEKRDQFQASKLFRLAAATAGRRGSARFQAEFHSKHGRRRRTVVQIQRWGKEPGNRSYLVSFLPSESQARTAVVDQTVVMQAVARRVSRLLQGAATCSLALAAEADPADERFAVLSALIDRAQGLLGSLEARALAEDPSGAEA